MKRLPLIALVVLVLGPIAAILISELFLRTAVAEIPPSSSRDLAATEATGPTSGLCWAVTSATAPACLTDAAGPVYVPEGTVVRLHAVAAANPFFTQAAAGDLTVTANTLAVTDAATAGCYGASDCADGRAPTVPLGAGGVDYFRFTRAMFSPKGTNIAVGSRSGVCETTGGGASAIETSRPCRQDSDCDVTGYQACDTSPEQRFGPSGGFICATAPASTYVCASFME